MGVNRFANECKLKGVDLVAAGVTAEQAVGMYREANPAIKAAWYALNRTALATVKTQQMGYACKCRFAYVGGALVVNLPSGRDLVYREARVESVPAKWDDTQMIEAVTFLKGAGYRSQLYGGKLAENIVQAICRDLLFHAGVRASREGIEIVMHVHDELVAEVHEADAGALLLRLCIIMSEGAPWSKGFPIGVEGFTCKRYVKSAWSDSMECHAVNGKIIKHGRKK